VPVSLPASVLAGVAALVLAGCATTGDDAERDPDELADAPMALDIARTEPGMRAAQADDYAAALPLLRDEARRGSTPAARALGRIHRAGLAGPRSRAAAGDAYFLGARLGDSVSQYQLGRLYYQGLDFPLDLERARYWFRRAAEQDHAGAQYALYNMTLQGLGGEANVATALGWAYRARGNGSNLAEVAWSNRELMVDAELARAIQEKLGADKLPRQPRFRETRARALATAPTQARDGGGEAPQAPQLRFPIGDGEEVRLVGARELEDALPVDGIVRPWVGLSVEITAVVRRVSSALEGEAEIVVARLRSEYATDGSSRLRISSEGYIRGGG